MVFGASAALAQSSLGIGVAEPAIDTSGTFGALLAWVNTMQQDFYRALNGTLADMREDPYRLWGLVGLSFSYGVFHAAGPGHGKAVISSYMIANETALRRGVVLSFASALMQGAVAIIVVAAAYLLLRGTGITMTRATSTLEMASFALIAGFGLWLLARKIRSLVMAQRTSTSSPVLSAHTPHHHHHDHKGTACSDCGHLHAPDPVRLGGADRLKFGEAASAVMAVGLRPCSGAVLVLTFAVLNGLYLGGALSVLAMSIGTAITVSILAILAVSAKDAALRLSGTGSAALVGHVIEITGAALIAVLGIILLAAALQA